MDSGGDDQDRALDSAGQSLLNSMRNIVQARDSHAEDILEKIVSSTILDSKRQFHYSKEWHLSDTNRYEGLCCKHLVLAIDDATLRRFLRAREFNVEKASEFFLKYLKWRRTFTPLGYIPETDIYNELQKRKIFMQGLDKEGHPIGVILAARHNAFQRDIEEFKRLVVYGFDKICASMPAGQEKFVIIADLEGWGYKNVDIRAYLGALDILQEYFPERLAKVFMIHVPYIFSAAWKLVYPFIDKATKKKIIFVDDKDLKETLLSNIDESQLPEIYGGKLPLVPVQDCVTANWPPVMLS